MTTYTDPFGLFRAQPTPAEDTLKRWVGKITLWCATRTAYVEDGDEDSADEDGLHVVGEDLADRLNWLPGELLADFQATQGRDPTPREMFDRYQKALKIAGFEWDADQERPEPWGDDKATLLVSFDDATLNRGRAYAEYGIEIGNWLNEYTVAANDDDCWPWQGVEDYPDQDPDCSPGDTAQNPQIGPEVWEVLTPARKKARPFPGRPAHWPHRNARRTRARRRNNQKRGSR